MADKPRGTGLGSLPRPALRPGAGHALLWMLFVAELMEYGLQPQLTTGEDVHWTGADPCRNPAPVSPVPPCTCRYGLLKVADAPAPWIPVYKPGIRRPDLRTAAFRIDSRCEHHGELRRTEYFDATYDGPGPAYEHVLDPDERTGH